MSRKNLAKLMRARMQGASNQALQRHQPSDPLHPPLMDSASETCGGSSSNSSQGFTLKDVKESMHVSISVPAGRAESVDSSLEEFSQGYIALSQEARCELLLALARDYDVNRSRVADLMRQYLSLELPHGAATGDEQSGGLEEDGMLSAFYRIERNLRDALKPMYAVFFERLNAHRGGLKLLATLRADLLSLLGKENVPSLRSLDSYLKEMLITWLSPAALELHQITWRDSAALLEKIVAYEAVHPIKNLLDLKRRLSVGRRCFGYLHPALPGEPLIFIEVALLKDVATSIQEVLWNDPPTPEHEATCALFYSISSTQPGLSGINLGKFLIKRVVDLLRREMPYITIFATLSPIPGYMQWLLSKLASQMNLVKSEADEMGSSATFKENILLPEEERIILDYSGEYSTGKGALEIMHDLLTSSEWTKSDHMMAAVKLPLMRLCARYLLKEKKRGKALDVVANFHLQNGAIIERINWMADQSEKGILQSGGIMVNYVYRLDRIDENAQHYFNTGHIQASSDLQQYLEQSKN